MRAKSLKIAATSAALVLALVGLLYTTVSEGTEYFKHVDEVATDPAAWHGKKLQVHGFARAIARRPNTLEHRFEVEHNGQVIQAHYNGVVPDTFKDGSEVVVKGEFGPHGFVVAPNGVMAKCPSKYEEAPTLPGKPRS